MADFIKQDKEVRLLSYKILVDRFNEKYSNLNEVTHSLAALFPYILKDETG
jgi:hypothetical protein